MIPENEFNIQQHNIDPVKLVDVVSSTIIYIGISNNTKNTTKAVWRIQKISQIATVWNFEFPNGDQDFKYVWDLRDSYSYSA
jgi:hypothetical protein